MCYVHRRGICVAATQVQECAFRKDFYLWQQLRSNSGFKADFKSVINKTLDIHSFFVALAQVYEGTFRIHSRHEDLNYDNSQICTRKFFRGSSSGLWVHFQDSQLILKYVMTSVIHFKYFYLWQEPRFKFSMQELALDVRFEQLKNHIFRTAYQN